MLLPQSDSPEPPYSQHNLRGLRVLYLGAGWDEINRVFDTLTTKLRWVTVAGEVDGDSAVSVSFRGKKKVTRWQGPRVRNPGQRNLFRYVVILAMNALLLLQLSVIRSIPSDIAICQSPLYVLMMKPFRELGIVKRIVFYTGDYFPPTNDGSFLERNMPRLSSRIDELAWDWSDDIWCYNHFLRRRISKRNPALATKVVPPLYFPVRDQAPDMRTPSIVFAGSIRLDAGLDIVMKAMSKLTDLENAPRLLIFGRPLNESVNQSIIELASNLGLGNRVILKGYTPIQELQREFQKALCGVAIFPGGESNYSNFAYPNKIKSYLENGIPAIIGRSSALREHAELQESCIFVEETPEALANVFHTLITNPRIAERMGAAGFKYACQQRLSPILFESLQDVASQIR